jgi:hypothetical protein
MIKLMSPCRFRDIPTFTPFTGYSVDVSWQHLESHIRAETEGANVDFNPDFQRDHVWTLDKRSAYIEFVLRGGDSANNLYFNCGSYQLVSGPPREYVLVDGKQRLTSIRMFLRDEVPIFGGCVRSDFVDKLDFLKARVRWNVNTLQTRAEILQWYLDLNTGGVVHTDEEIDRVRAMLEAEQAKDNQ